MMIQPSRMNRRQLMLGSLVAGSTFAVLSRGGYTQETPTPGSENGAEDSLPSYIDPSDISYDQEIEEGAREIPDYETAEKEFSFIPFKATAMPTDWIHQPGIAYNKEIDLFLGAIHDNIQTLVWAYSESVAPGTTAEEKMNEIADLLYFDQQMIISGRPDLSREYLDSPGYFLTEIGMFSQGWAVDAHMPGEAAGIHNANISNMGFIFEDYAFLFYVKTSMNFPLGLNEATKFYRMVESIQPKS